MMVVNNLNRYSFGFPVNVGGEISAVSCLFDHRTERIKVKLIPLAFMLNKFKG